MKAVYIPKGESVSFSDLTMDHIVVKGCLFISGELTAKSISGSGSVSAGQICADRIRVDDLTAGCVCCDDLTAKKVEAFEISASERVAVSGQLTAGSVETKRLAMTRSSIDEVKAKEIICLPAKRRSLFRFLLASALRSWWTRFTAPKDDVVDADYEPVEKEKKSVVDFETEKNNRPAA